MEEKRARLASHNVNSNKLDIYNNVAYQLTLSHGENEQEKKENWNTDNDNNNNDNNNNDDNNCNTAIVEKKSCLMTKLIENEIYTCEVVPMDKNSGKLGVPYSVSFQTTTPAAPPAPGTMFKKEAKWSVACCDKIKVTNNDLEIIYCDENETNMHHKMYFGDKMDLSNNGIFEMEIEILDMGHGSNAFVFGISTEDNKYFECDEGRFGGFCCRKGKG